MKVHVVDQDRIKDMVDRFMELTEAYRGAVLVQLLCGDASLSGRPLADELLHLLSGIKEYVDWGLESKKISDAGHEKGIGIVSGLYDAIVEYTKSRCITDDEKA